MIHSAGDDLFTTYKDARVFGSAWRCDLCSTTQADPSVSLTCNCTAARSVYVENNPSVTVDPWVHYTTAGKFQVINIESRGNVIAEVGKAGYILFSAYFPL